MASSADAGPEEGPSRRLILSFVVFAAVFAAAEYVVERIPGFLFVRLNVDSQSPSVLSLYYTVSSGLRVAMVPFALFFAFYLLASRSDLDLRRSYFAVAVSILVGTLLVFLPVELVESVTSKPLPGFSPSGAALESIGGAFGSSLSHSFIGFSAAFLWQYLAWRGSTPRPQATARRLHGTEDVSIVGVVMVAVYVWEYLAQAYQAMYPLGANDELAAFFASLLGGGSPFFYPFAIWQQALLLTVLPFVLFFLIARKERLDPFVQGRRIALVVFLWGLFLRTFTSFFYVYIARIFDRNAFPGATLASTMAGELVPMNLFGVIASTFDFLFLGITAVAFAFYMRRDSGEALPPPQLKAFRKEREVLSDCRRSLVSRPHAR